MRYSIMEIAGFFKTLLNMTVPGFYLSLIIVFILHIRRRVKGNPGLPWSKQLLLLVLCTAGVTVVLTVVVWILLFVLSMVDAAQS